jgi:L-lysine 2,3-aminomutase
MATILAASGSSVEATFTPASTWQEAMKRAIRDGRELCKLLGIDPELADMGAAGQFPVFAPLEFVKRMMPGNPRDPLLLQVLSTEAERGQLWHLGDGDPVGDGAAERRPGILQKYRGRALVLASGACAVHCRYCFRRHYPYDHLPVGRDAWKPVIETLADDMSLQEVIFSGGDPLTLVDDQLSWLVERVDEIPHVKRLRFHTRVPVVIPQRVTEGFLALLAGRRAASYVVLHCNHVNEIDDAVANACQRMRHAGAVLLNQAVLLRSINDSFDSQLALCQRLVDIGVLPYYLHQLDRVAGGVHFEVEDQRGLEIIASLREHLPGYAVPQFVREVAGQPSKTPIAHVGKVDSV